MKMMTPPLACVASQRRMPDREWVRSKRRAENPEIWKEEDELKLDFLDTDKVDRMGRKESEVVQCSWHEDLQNSIDEPLESQGGRGGRGRRTTARSKGR